MTQAPVKPDLGALRIEAHKRGSRRPGKLIAMSLSVLLMVLLIAAGGYVYMHQPPSVQVATADAPDTGPAALLNASGYVTPQRRATVAAKITGRVTGVFFTEGMHVQKGFVLATLDDSDSQKALASAKADRSATQASILDLQVQLKNAQIHAETGPGTARRRHSDSGSARQRNHGRQQPAGKDRLRPAAGPRC